MQKSLLILAIAAALAGCSSVKLDDKAAAADAAAAGAAGQSSVAPVGVDAGLASRGGPQDVAHVVHFDFDSYVVRSDARPVVEGNARYLKARQASRVVLEGHTDEVGGREYNLALGQKRAEAVRRSLSLLGVPDAQMEAVSFGKERPAVPGSGENEKNRRVEFNYK